MLIIINYIYFAIDITEAISLSIWLHSTGKFIYSLPYLASNNTH